MKSDKNQSLPEGSEDAKKIEEEASEAKLRKPRSKWNPAPPNQWSNTEEEWYNQNEWRSPFHE
jgi:hypothetical protein